MARAHEAGVRESACHRRRDGARGLQSAAGAAARAMTGNDGDGGVLRRVVTRLRQTSLAVRITVVGAFVTATAIAMALWALNAETRAGTRRVFAAQLSRQQRALLNLQQQNLRTLISSAAIISESPTLRSAMETYRVEQNSGGALRKDLVRTVERELANLVTG